MTDYTEQVKETIKNLQYYWYYAGEWHNAGCSFVTTDQGLCNCATKANKKEIKELLNTLIETARKEAVRDFAHWYDKSPYLEGDIEEYLSQTKGGRE